MPDIKLKCTDCGQAFLFTEKEQAFYEQKGFRTQPKRCADCRKRRDEKQRQHRREKNGGSW
ncbi:MAG: zinc-ribbon domain containing protein [Eubacteriales bacterium]